MTVWKSSLTHSYANIPKIAQELELRVAAQRIIRKIQIGVVK